MSESSIVDGYNVGVGLQSEIPICIGTPTLRDVAGISMDLFAGTCQRWPSQVDIDNSIVSYN